MSKYAEAYKHFYAPARPDPRFPGGYKRTLVTTVDEMKRSLDPLQSAQATIIGFDTETTGLDHSKDKICGFSYAVTGDEGFYVPIRHLVGTNAPAKCLEFMVNVLKMCDRTLIYNARFDLRFLEADNFSIEGIKYYDVSIPVWLADTNKAFPCRS